MATYTGPPLPAGALDAMLQRLLREAADYERRIRKAGEPGEPEHHLPNLRRAWYGQVRIIVRQWVEEHRGRGRSRRVRELEARIANDPRWTQLIKRMSTAGAVVI